MSFATIVFAIACIAAGFFIGIVAMQEEWQQYFYENLPFILSGLVIMAILFALAAAIGYFALKWWIKHKLKVEGDFTGEEIVTGLADRLTNREELVAPTTNDRAHSLMVNLGLYYVRSVALQRYFLVIGGLFTALVGLATVFLLYEQNKKLDLQTEQIKIQSQANTAASLLMEGTRRAALSAEQTALFEAIRTEAASIRKDDESKADRACNQNVWSKTEYNQRSCWSEVSGANGRKLELAYLSEKLLQRVRAYALRATPYPITRKKSLNEVDIKIPLDHQYQFPSISPERGQLLLTLMFNDVEVSSIVFAYADLRGLDLSRAFLTSESIRGVDLANSDLSTANLTETVLRGVSFWRARLASADLGNADLGGANLDEAILLGAKLVKTDLTGASLRRAMLNEADLTDAIMVGTTLWNATLIGTSFDGADLTGASFWQANFAGTDLGNVDLTGADIAEADFRFILGIPTTNSKRRQIIEDWFRKHFSGARGLNEAKLPAGYVVYCSEEIEKFTPEQIGDNCPADNGWTIEYEDQPEFEPEKNGDK